jgi:sec-independent protein translocase protein TatC
MEKKATFWEHLEELRARTIYCLVTVFSIALFCFLFGLRSADVGGFQFYYPYPELYDNINTIVFNQMRADLINDPRIELIPIGIADPVIVQLEISLFLGILFGMPIIVYQFGMFVSPGLYPHERAILVKTALPATLLFAAGCAIAYFLIIPFTIEFLYGYAFAMDVQPFLSLESFISFVIIFLIAYGLVFELPIVMVGITRLGVVSSEFWRDNWRYAFVAMVIFGAVVTPDGSGITQLIVAMPMLLLYVMGYFISKRVQKG